MKNLPGAFPLFFRAGLPLIRGFIERLTSLFTITQQDLIDAGVHFTQVRD